jgi:hypothetical protein
MISKLEQLVKDDSHEEKDNEAIIYKLQKQLEISENELKAAKRQKIREIAKKPDQIEVIEKTYEEIEDELEKLITGLKNHIEIIDNRQSTIIRVNRIARTAIDIFNDIIEKPSFTKMDLALIIEKIIVYENHVEIKLKRDIDTLLSMGKSEDLQNFSHDTKNIENKSITQMSDKHESKVFSVNVINSGDPLEIFTDHEGEVIFKKYSPIGELAGVAVQYADALNKTCGLTIVVIDRDVVVACAGAPKKDILEHRISNEIENIIDSRQLYVWRKDAEKILISDKQEKYFTQLAMPILQKAT